MKNENNDTKKKLALMILAPLFCTIGGVSLFMSGLEDNDKPTIIVACFILLLDVVMIVAFLADWFKKR